MKPTILSLIILILISCNHSNQTKKTINSDFVETSKDTVLVKVENKIVNSYDIGFYSKSYTYFWVVDQDTLDFKIGLTEYVTDSSVHLRAFHRNPILFTTVLEKMIECVPMIQQNFEMNNLGSLYFKAPIFYLDLTTKLSEDYKSQFGQKNIKYEQLNKFLMGSWLEQKVSIFLDQFDKSTKRYGIEKFHLLDKQYYIEYIPNSDLNEYPDFSIHGMGISVSINEQKKPVPNNGEHEEPL